MRPVPRHGLTLLEVMVALVILTLVGLGYLDIIHQSHEVIGNARTWSDAVALAEATMEQARFESQGLPQPRSESATGVHRQITRRPWQPGFVLVTVSVFLPGGGQFDLNRLVKVRSDTDADTGSIGSSEEW
jgi:prepilin-type N-terminal cleavage/methylation domain-containing protein